MEYNVDRELQRICGEIREENKSEAEWARIEASDWFQTPHYNGGFDATDMHFAFTIYLNSEKFCFAISLSEALRIADGSIRKIQIEPSPWAE